MKTIEVTLKISDYAGAFSSSITNKRCYQLLAIWELLQNEYTDDDEFSYKDFQKAMETHAVFGKTKVPSAIRTFFPVLQSLGFIKVREKYSRTELFTRLGLSLIKVAEANRLISELPQDEKTIREKHLFGKLKSHIIREGLKFMAANTKDNKLWIVLNLLYRLKTICLDEYLYALYLLKEEKSYEAISTQIMNNRLENTEYVFSFEKHDTAISYLLALLKESEIIVDNTYNSDMDNFVYNLNVLKS